MSAVRPVVIPERIAQAVEYTIRALHSPGITALAFPSSEVLWYTLQGLDPDERACWGRVRTDRGWALMRIQ